MDLVHEADPVLDIVKLWRDLSGELLLTKKGAGLEAFNRTGALEIGMKITPDTKWKDLLKSSPKVTALAGDDFPFCQRSANDAFLQSEY